MRNSRGSVAVWVLMILIIVLVAGVAYWYGMQSSSQPVTTATTEVPATQQTTATQQPQTQTPIQAPAQTNRPSSTENNSIPPATIDQGSLATGTATPTITGTFSPGISTIDVIVGLLPPVASNATKGFTGFPGMVWNDRATLTGNRYSNTISNPLPNGKYYIGIYERTNVPTNTGEAVYNSPFTDTLLTSGTFTVTDSSQASLEFASIDQSSLSASASASPLVITGEASNVSAVIVSVKTSGSNGTMLFTSAPQQVINGKWQATVADQINGAAAQLPTGQYVVSVWDTSNEFLAAGTLTVH